MKISILGSGSEGNATYVEVGGLPFLIDAGFSAKTLISRMHGIGLNPATIRAILVTHEHNDHIKGVGILSRKLNLPIYITPESYQVSESSLGKIAPNNLHFIDGAFEIEDVRFIPFNVNHDAVRTVGFRIEGANGKCMAISTDIGCYTEEVVAHFADVDLMVLEANYDYDMLQRCDYPYYLKQRIHSPNGHLSNVDSGKLIGDSYHPNLKKVYLAHVSKNSNTYDLAFSTVQNELKSRGIEVDMEVAYQGTVTELFAI
jgi:Metal-dependent hydrolases of the beta-lactamase superfamily I